LALNGIEEKGRKRKRGCLAMAACAATFLSDLQREEAAARGSRKRERGEKRGGDRDH